jgi:carboxylesterase type B
MRDALVEGPNCAQIEIFKKEFKGEEDCLYLNVYTPKVRVFWTKKSTAQPDNLTKSMKWNPSWEANSFSDV